jgi:hypothetical protein
LGIEFIRLLKFHLRELHQDKPLCLGRHIAVLFGVDAAPNPSLFADVRSDGSVSRRRFGLSR